MNAKDRYLLLLKRNKKNKNIGENAVNNVNDNGYEVSTVAADLLATAEEDQEQQNSPAAHIDFLCGSTNNVDVDCDDDDDDNNDSDNNNNNDDQYRQAANDGDSDGEDRGARDNRDNDSESLINDYINNIENDQVIQYLDNELIARTKELTDRLLIAHGNVLQLITEQAGVLKDWNYSRVQRTRRTLGGGMYARQWMSVFSESLRLGMKARPSMKSSLSPSASPSVSAFDTGSTYCATAATDTNTNTGGATPTTPNMYSDYANDNYSEYNSDYKFSNEQQQQQQDKQQHNFYDDDYYNDDNDDCDDGFNEEAALLPLRQQQQQQNPYAYDDDDQFIDDAYHNNDKEEDDNDMCHCSPKCCLDTSLEKSLALIEKITQTIQPIGILLDLKSRHVPKRVLSLIIKCLQTAGIRVVGIASFQISEIRGVCSSSSNSNDNNNNNNPVTTIGTSTSASANASTASRQRMPSKQRIIGTATSAGGSSVSSFADNNNNNNNNNNIRASVNSNHNHNTNTTKEILMVHSAGDLQAACDEGLVQPGDHVFFNGGSLILDSARSSTIKTLLGAVMDMCVCGYLNTFDPCVIEDGYRIQSYGYCNPSFSMDNVTAMNTTTGVVGCGVVGGVGPSSFPYKSNVISDSGGSGGNSIHHRITNNNKDDDDDDITLNMTGSEDDGHNGRHGVRPCNRSEVGSVMRTLADYKRHYGFAMGMYCQEFSIDEAAARLLIELVNNNPSLYDLGLAWGGINGMTVHGIQPGRFTSTDGYWNQRRVGRIWKEI